jgi:hypothetical protein
LVLIKLIIVLFLLFMLVRSFIIRKNNLPVKLFAEGLRIENNGRYEEAVIAYHNAMEEARKRRFQGDLCIRIEAKLKILDTLIAYNNNLRFIR